MIIEEITERPYYEEIIDRFNLEEDYPSITVAPQIQDINEMAHLWADLGTFGQIEYGLGVWAWETFCGTTFVGHSGGIIYTANLAYVEEYDLTVAVMTNDGDQIDELDGVIGITEEIICEYETSLTNTNELVQADYSLQVYPNPFDQFITLEYHNDSFDPLRLEIFNELGQLIETKEYSDQQTINENVLSDPGITSGIYYLRFTIGDKNECIKVIKT